jgi:hypothetical protein
MEAAMSFTEMSWARRIFAGLIGSTWLLLMLSAPASAQAIFTWTNEYGSTLTVTSFNQTTGAISGSYTNNASSSCDEGAAQAMTGWLVQGSTGTAISFSVNFLNCNSSTVWTGQLNNTSGFQALWLLSLAEPVVWNGISAGADTFTLVSGDKSKLMPKSTDNTKSSPPGTEKLSNTKK